MYLSEWLQVTDSPFYRRKNTWASLDHPPVMLLHTIEGGLRYSTARQHTSPPHVWYSADRREAFQTVSLDYPAFALVNRSGGGQTNRRGPLFQVELEGFAKDTYTWSDQKLKNIAEDIIAPIARYCQEKFGKNLLVANELKFLDERSGVLLASVRSANRLSTDRFNNIRGLVGHQHTPENSHWDPGAIDSQKLLGYSIDAVKDGRELVLNNAAYLRGNDVKILQQEIIDAGFGSQLSPANVADGVYGPATERARVAMVASRDIQPPPLVEPPKETKCQKTLEAIRSLLI